ncbi:Peptidoglycan/xylan/chitin deacetylase, PgdA/CDA1 family [Alkalithermobacter thermoalcaliphilus JW-YL-7 = DSM 7308]|uniref:Peptidoglycan/xylan/chitin deacetylase, PgdA/CDA1 family n=1 Tax=Alkalithermobacter thermoalcaliphilus JW-YL-7 = DSM 7308 TaxID=1121328 RepID=A0A150FS15_CLOPD|nr:polysaccharide deacetylase [[Clostridium] paradoxum JW-YL-7 = DSM 7308]SHK59327.1 Peptidoglycan/xylan/chitin deacetylase, PgdA/CDA1 family [[Clostridium] paradoxum JW-YL-7 = DSM 7308]
MIIIVNKRKLLLLTAICILTVGIYITTSLSVFTFKTLSEPYYKGNKEKSNYVAITCNVDWGNEYIEDILKILESKDVKITFMVTGRWAKKYPDILLKIKENGHEIGNHGFRHIDYSKLDYKTNYEEIKEAKDIIEGIIDDKTRFFSPPSGSFNKNTIKAALDLKYIPVQWTIDTADWLYKDNPQKIIQRVQNKTIDSESIILLHPTEATVKTLGSIIEIVTGEGYKVGRLMDIFEVD